MELWRERKEAVHEQRQYEREIAQSEALKKSQTYRMLAIAGAVGLGVVGVGLLLR